MGQKASTVSPFRTAPQNTSRSTKLARSVPDAELLPACTLAWIAALLRLSAGVFRADPFGIDAALAVVLLLGLPWMLSSSLVACARLVWAKR